ncbi:MAG: hypothetical protein IAE98_00350 [Candidatus Kapabacteria bacterium]|nr:hypothetical protein [Candidatus Kapabacteria bacterium]
MKSFISRNTETEILSTFSEGRGKRKSLKTKNFELATINKLSGFHSILNHYSSDTRKLTKRLILYKEKYL